MTQTGMALSRQWCNGDIDDGGNVKSSTRLNSLRNKIHKHVTSAAHSLACEIRRNKAQAVLKQTFAAQNVTAEHSTECVFRTVYYVAKCNRPFTDHESLIDLQQLNGVDLGKILHSRYTATNIVNHIADEMRKRVVNDIVSSSAKLAVLIDESTTLSHLSVMVVYLRAAVNGGDPLFIFLNLVELESQTAECITTQLVKCLKDSGFSEEYLQKNWVSFVSDGASVMFGKKSGVATRLRAKYPAIFLWHCMNHRLELAVADAVKDVSAATHFKHFLDSIYSLFSQSSKNQRELSEACRELEVQFLHVGRVLDIRWVSSSLRTVRAVWTCFGALHAMFTAAAHDQHRDSKTRSKFSGLAKHLASIQFVHDIGLMYDVLHELSSLSLELQKQAMTLDKADRLVKRTIRVLESFKLNPSEHLAEANVAKERMEFKTVKLLDITKQSAIDKNQFIQSIVDNLRARLCEPDDIDAHILRDCLIFDTETWPTVPDIRFGESEVRRLCQRFKLDAREAVEGMREFVDDKPAQIPDGLKNLHACLKTLPCSTAECERAFSLINIISTDLRSTILVKNLSSLMLANLDGPPIRMWRPESYVKSWLRFHRSANETQSKKRRHEDADVAASHLKLWSLL